MEKRTVGTVVSVKKQWWLKVNTTPVRMSSLDGATFPYIIKVKYSVGDREFFKRKWISAGTTPPLLGASLTVKYQEDKPEKSKVVL